MPSSKPSGKSNRPYRQPMLPTISRERINEILSQSPSAPAELFTIAAKMGVSYRRLYSALNARGFRFGKGMKTIPLSENERKKREEEAVKLVNEYLPRFLKAEGIRTRLNDVDMDELRSLCHLSTVSCIHRFDPSYGATFRTYVVDSWKGNLKSMLELRGRRLGRGDISIDQTERARNSLDEIVFREWKKERNADTASFDAEKNRRKVMSVFSQLGKVHQQVLTYRYGLDGNKPMTQVEIGKIMGRSHTAISMSEAKAIRELRKLVQQK